MAAHGLAAAFLIDRVLAQHFRDILMGALFVAAKVDGNVAVARDSLPAVFKEGFKLRQVLNDDVAGDFPRSHGR